MKVIVTYDFVAQAGSSELTICKDDILTILNKDIGEGWWEGINSRGERGLFPASYVEPYDDTPPPPPPPPLQPHLPVSGASQQVPGDVHRQSAAGSSFFNTNQIAQFKGPADTGGQPKAEPLGFHEEPDWPDDDWDDDEDSGDGGDFGTQNRRAYQMGAGHHYANQVSAGNMNDLSSATSNLAISDNRVQSVANLARTKKNLNRFSNFNKSALEDYLLTGKSIEVSLENAITILYDQELGIMWKPILNPYTCAVTKHGKETKMKGLKTYISYDITPSTNGLPVRRRYKHFDWLFQRLVEKFKFVAPIPPLPEKQVAGRFQEDFVEHRRNLLQLWANYITRHPVLSQCDVWWHFMTCSSDDSGWKQGKRKAEKDELVGGNFFFAVEIHPTVTPLEPVKATKQLDNFHRFVSKFDEAVKHMYNTAVDQSQKFSNSYAKDYKKLSESIKELASAFQSGTAWRNSLGLNEAIRQTSAAYDEISRMHEEEPKYDFEPMADILHQYKGLLSGWPEILQSHRNATNTRHEQERLMEEGKIGETEMAVVNQRVNVKTYATLAEINHFHNERLLDFKQMMQMFLTAQINFHSDILGKLQTALNKINDA